HSPLGKNRSGDTDLRVAGARAPRVGVAIVPRALAGGEPVSSSRVRAAIEAGDVSGAGELLGRPYRLRGVVGTGAKRGRTLGFPTANLEQIETLIPGDGVYAARAVLEDGAAWPAAVNIGPNPTFGEQARKVEAHLIGFAGDLY